MKDPMKGHFPKLNTTAEGMLCPEKQTDLVEKFNWCRFCKKSPSHKYGRHFYLQLFCGSIFPLQIVFLFTHTCSHLDWQPGTFWELKNGNKKPLFISELVETFEYGTIEMMRQPFWLPEEPRSHRIDVDKSQAGKRADDQKDFSNQQLDDYVYFHVCSLSEQTKNLPVWFVRFHSLSGLWIGELMNQREKFRSWWINSFSLLSPPYPQCLEHTHSNASCLIVPELLGHIVRHGDHLSRKNHYHFVLYTIKVLGLVKVKCHILSLDIVLLTWQGCLLFFGTFFALRQLGEFALWLIFKPCHINRDKNCSKFSTTFSIQTALIHSLWQFAVWS